jgi:hypothetical protein
MLLTIVRACHIPATPSPARSARITSLGKSNGWLQVVRVLCPFCGREHVHGWPITEPPTLEIVRFASCNRVDGCRYRIAAEAPASPPPSPKRAV